ncbi:ankyrin repeat-containing domain protein [Xylaria cubensis]|nr:ankyrin repeat-containing domain protein [Xylaria cubensis]
MMNHTLVGQGNDGVDNVGNVIEYHCECRSESIKLAIESGDIERVNILIDRCTDDKQQGGHLSYALLIALPLSTTEMVNNLVKKVANVSKSGADLNLALRIAVGYSNMEVVDFLIKKVANVSQSSEDLNLALYTAVQCSNMEMVDVFIKKGADVNQQYERYGNILQAAIIYSNMEMVDLVINMGAVVNQQGGDYGNALQAAVVKSNLETVQYLVDKGADVCLQNKFQMTALHYAVRRMDVGIVEFLLGKNARPDAKSDTDATPFDLAIQLGNTEIIQLLLPKMESAPILSGKTWRNALHLESAKALMFTFREHLSVEPIEDFKLPEFTRYDEKARYIRYFNCQSDTSQQMSIERDIFLKSIPQAPAHIVLNNGMHYLISVSSTFKCQWWRRDYELRTFSPKPEASLLPNSDLCRQLDRHDFLIENWFTISCLTITDSNWPSQQTPIPETYDQLEQVEGFFCTIAKRPQNDFTGSSSTEEPPLLRPVFSVTTCGDTPVKLIESIEDLITPLIEKFGLIFEKNNFQAGRQLSNARLEVLRNSGRNEGLLPRLLSDATVIEYMTENHAHIVRSLTGLIDCVAQLQDGPWKLSKQAEKDGREGIKRLAAHRETLRELLERSQNIIQLEFNLASILEARKSTSTNRSMKRLTWVTFVFLPLLFVASLFGMNVDILSNNPSWWWYFPVAGGFVLLTFGVWIFFKRFNTLEGSLERYFAWLVGDGIPADDVKQPTRNGEQRGGDKWADLKKFV